MKLITLHLSLIIFAALLSACTEDSVNLSHTDVAVTHGVLTGACSYTFTDSAEGSQLDISCDEQPLYSLSADSLWTIATDKSAGFERILTDDINGDGSPEIFIGAERGKCCISYSILSFAERVREQELPPTIGGEPQLIDIDKDGKYEIWASDSTFYIPGYSEEPGFITNVFTDIILEAHGSEYVLSTRLMKKKSSREIALQIKRQREESRSDIPDSVIAFAVELIFAGQGDRAWSYLDSIYNGTVLEEHKDEIANEILMKLVDGPYWTAISRANQWSYEQPDGEMGCPEFAGRGWLISSR